MGSRLLFKCTRDLTHLASQMRHQSNVSFEGVKRFISVMLTFLC